jgi:predicted phosphoribosyltransferase
MFRNREDAALRLAQRLKDRPLRDPMVLAIPRGGVVTGAVLAEELHADLDVVLARKLRAPGQPEVALGAIAEDGRVYLDPYTQAILDLGDDHLAEERTLQQSLLARRRRCYRRVRPQAPVAGRSVIVTDDGLATGSTMIAALRVVRPQDPYELIAAVPVAAPERLEEVRRWCDDLVCLLAPPAFWAVGPFYEDFTAVSEEQVLALLREFTARPRPRRARTGT